MEAFQQFLQSRGFSGSEKQHRRLTDTIRSRATSDGNVRISTIMSNIRNENEVHFSDSDDEVIIEDEPLGIIQINNDIDDDFDSFYNTRRESFGGGGGGSRNQNFIITDQCNNEIDKSYEYVAAQSTAPHRLKLQYQMNCIRIDLSLKFQVKISKCQLYCYRYFRLLQDFV